MYYNTDCLIANRKKTVMIYLTQEQKRAVVSKVGEAGLYLFEFLVSKSATPRYEYSDEKNARALGWSVRKAKDYRLKLSQCGLYEKETYGSGEKKAIIYKIGDSLSDIMLELKRKEDLGESNEKN